MIKHTPGPWKVSSSTMVIVDNGKLKVICNTLPLLYEEIQEEEISFSQASANARLISAAPDLLEACYRMLQQFGGCFNENDRKALSITEKAIIRATGEQNCFPPTFGTTQI